MTLIKFEKFAVEFTLGNGRQFTALKGLDLDIPKGQFVCIVGKSGGGKSTLVRSLAGLTLPTGGKLTVDGQPVTGPSRDRAMVFQEDTVFPWMRVDENVGFGLQGLLPEKKRERIEKWLQAVGLADFSKAWPRELSGGMRKRVALATVFAMGSPVLIMDEPFGALDFVTRANIHAILLDLWRASGTTVVFVTHDIEEALVLGDRILVVSDGRILDDLSCDLARPRDEDVLGSTKAVGLRKAIIGHLGIGRQPMLESADQ